MKAKHLKNKKNRKNTSRIDKILLIIFIAIFIYSSYKVIYWLKSNRDLQKLENNIFSEVVQEINNEDESETKGETTKIIDFDALTQINQDVIAWISIDNTRVNYPILQAKDNNYYLRKDLYKSNNSCGSIFLDCNTNPNFSEQNTVIYGHHLTRGGMFTDLDKIYKGELGKEVYIQIYTKQGLNTYQVIAAHIAVPELSIVKKSFSKAEERQAYIDNAIKNSKIKFKQPTNLQGNIITLITCYGKQRTVVNAIKVM